MGKVNSIILSLSIAVWVFCYTAWMFFGKEWFELGQSFIIFGASLAFLRERKCIPTEVFFILGVNQLADELFFNPYLFTWNEYLTIGLLLLPIFLQKSYSTLITRFILRRRKR